MKKNIHTLLLTPLFVGMAASANAAIVSNGTGGGGFTDGSTWTGGTTPTSSDSWTVQTGDIVTSAATISSSIGGTQIVNGTLDLGANHLNVGGGSGIEPHGEWSDDCGSRFH